MLRLTNSVLMLGYGAVARSVLPILVERLRAPADRITIIDKTDCAGALDSWIKRGITFRRETITQENFTRVLSQFVQPGGLIVDLSLNVDCVDVLKWVKANGVLYISASVEDWNGHARISRKQMVERSLHSRYMLLDAMASRWRNSSTAIVDHGANPGLVSHFAKKGILDIAARSLRDNRFPPNEMREIERHVEDKDFARLAMKLGIKVIHCSETDTQKSTAPKEKGEFVGTWSTEGTAEECVLPVEIAWGTHENQRIKNVLRPDEVAERGVIMLPQAGMDTRARSWLPHNEFVGMIVTHGESFSISKNLTIWNGRGASYRPTVHYVYRPSNETMLSLEEFRSRNYEMQPRRRIMTDDIESGKDILGVLLMGHPYKSWWTGSVLSIHQTRQLIRAPEQNATTVQVAAGVVSAIQWMMEHRSAGLHFPEDLPFDFILSKSIPYLGTIISEPSDWTPLKNRTADAAENGTWQFHNFLVE